MKLLRGQAHRELRAPTVLYDEAIGNTHAALWYLCTTLY